LKIIGWPLHYSQTRLVQTEFGDHERTQQPDEVRTDRIAETGMELFRDSRTTDGRSRFIYAHRKAFTREICGRN
jgi:hypothetical protein